MRNLFLRRNGLGLESIRNIKARMTKEAQIFRIDLGYRLPTHAYAFNWGNYDTGQYRFNNVINKVEAIREVSNKGVFRKKLYEAGLSMPTFTRVSELQPYTNVDMIVRPRNHLGGRDIVKTSHYAATVEAMRRFGDGSYASVYVPKVKEFRVFVAQGRVVYVVEKIVPDTTALAWNVHQGGRFENIRFGSWNLDVAEIAIKAFNLTSLDFGALDVIVDNEGKCYVLEINTAPLLTSDYWSTCIAKVFDYIIENGNERLSASLHRRNWRELVHPAISPEATTTTTRIERGEIVRTRERTQEVTWELNLSQDIPESVLEDIIQRIRNRATNGVIEYTVEETYTV